MTKQYPQGKQVENLERKHHILQKGKEIRGVEKFYADYRLSEMLKESDINKANKANQQNNRTNYICNQIEKK